jgi:hypothetical protein
VTRGGGANLRVTRSQHVLLLGEEEGGDGAAADLVLRGEIGTLLGDAVGVN